MSAGIVGPGIMDAQISLQQAQESQLLQRMRSADGADQKAKIENGAKQFEALLLSGWLQQVEQTMATVPGADDDPDGAGKDQMMSLGVQSLAQSLANSGGIGLGAMIAKAMLASAQKEETGNAQQPAQPATGIPGSRLDFQLKSGLKSADIIHDSGKGSQ